jgi:hypothetical protein
MSEGRQSKLRARQFAGQLFDAASSEADLNEFICFCSLLAYRGVHATLRDEFNTRIDRLTIAVEM